MTTVGVEVDDAKIYPKKMPSYTYPTHRRVQLSAVKTGIFHPNLPTFRQMDMDTCRHLLPDQHCRTTTSSGPDDFKRMTTTLFTPPAKRLSSFEITDTGRKLHRHYTTPDELKKTRDEWSKFLDRCPERYNIKLPELPSPENLHFVGYGVRYLRPELTRSWQYTLRQEPSIDQYGQRPMPANVFARYRDTYPQFSRDIAKETWR